MEDIAGKIAAVRRAIEEAARQAGRDPRGVTLVAVTKTVAPEAVRRAVEAGVLDLGENRVQEWLAKREAVGAGVRWHLIGHLQTNKVKHVLRGVHLLHSLDRWELAAAISRRMPPGESLPVLVQVNVSGETSKQGLAPAEVPGFLRRVAALPGVRVQGLMTMAPQVADPEEARPVFRRLRELAGELAGLGIPGVEMRELSMGMSGDFRVAVQEGATLVRIGSRIFGGR